MATKGDRSMQEVYNDYNVRNHTFWFYFHSEAPVYGHELLNIFRNFYLVGLKFDIFLKNKPRQAHQNAHSNITEDGTAVQGHPLIQVLSSKLLGIFSCGLKVN
jgi:hypothetical protein